MTETAAPYGVNAETGEVFPPHTEGVNQFTFKAWVYGLRTDKDGEGKLTLAIPMTEMLAAMRIARETEKELEVVVSLTGNALDGDEAD